MLDFIVLSVITHKVIIFIVPHQPPRTYFIPVAILAQFHFLLYIPLVIFKLDFAVTANSLMNFIHVKVDTFVHGLDPAGNENLPLQLLGFVPAGEAFQFFDQRIRFFPGDKFGSLYRIHKELQFRQFKIAVSDMVIKISLGLYFYNINPIMPQFFKITVQRFTICVHTEGVQLLNDLGKGKEMPVISLTH